MIAPSAEPLCFARCGSDPKDHGFHVTFYCTLPDSLRQHLHRGWRPAPSQRQGSPHQRALSAMNPVSARHFGAVARSWSKYSSIPHGPSWL